MALDHLSPVHSALQKNLCGTVLAQKYELLSFIGSGGMSDVYKAQHKLTGKVVAVKVLHEKHSSDVITIKRLKQEAKAAGALAHRNILGVHDIDVDESGMPFLVMDFVDGASLSDYLKSKGPLDLVTFLHIIAQITDALCHAQDKSVVHRDMKPSNVMLIDPEGECEVRIVDFGIAKLVGQDDATAHRLTQTGETFGSPSYMSPEQCMGLAVDCRSDMYSLGCVMYEALSGHVPFTGESIFDTVHKQVTATPPVLVAPKIKDEATRARLEAIILKCLAKEPNDRYQSFTDLQSELMKLQANSSTGVFANIQNAWHLAQAKKAARQKSKTPLLVISLVLMACLSIMSSGYLVYSTIEVNRNLQTVTRLNRARVRYLQSYVDTTQIYTSGQRYLRTRAQKYLDEVMQHKEHMNAMLRQADEMVKDEPEARARYGIMREKIAVGVDKFMQAVGGLPEDQASQSALFSFVPDLRKVIHYAAEGQKEIIQLQDAEDLTLDKIGKRVETLQQNQFIVAIFNVVLDVAILGALVFYFTRKRKKKAGSTEALPAPPPLTQPSN